VYTVHNKIYHTLLVYETIFYCEVKYIQYGYLIWQIKLYT